MTHSSGHLLGYWRSPLAPWSKCSFSNQPILSNIHVTCQLLSRLSILSPSRFQASLPCTSWRNSPHLLRSLESLELSIAHKVMRRSRETHKNKVPPRNHVFWTWIILLYRSSKCVRITYNLAEALTLRDGQWISYPFRAFGKMTCSTDRDRARVSMLLTSETRHILTHSNILATTWSWMPWPTTFTKPLCDKLPSNSDATCCRSRSLPWVKRDRSTVGKVIVVDQYLTAPAQSPGCKWLYILDSLIVLPTKSVHGALILRSGGWFAFQLIHHPALKRPFQDRSTSVSLFFPKEWTTLYAMAH